MIALKNESKPALGGRLVFPQALHTLPVSLGPESTARPRAGRPSHIPGTQINMVIEAGKPESVSWRHLAASEGALA